MDWLSDWQVKLPLGVNMCVYDALQWTGILSRLNPCLTPSIHGFHCDPGDKTLLKVNEWECRCNIVVWISKRVITKQNFGLIDWLIDVQQPLYLGQGQSGSEVYPRNIRYEAGIHSRWNTSWLQVTIFTHSFMHQSTEHSQSTHWHRACLWCL